MFRVFFAPILRYFEKLYMQHGNVVVVSVPVGCRMVGEWERPALAVAKSRIF
jgi:hypothetical protein